MIDPVDQVIDVRHPACVIDRRMAAMVVGMSINGQGSFWDGHAAACRPELEGEGGIHAGDILLAVQEDPSHMVSCTYRGSDVGHPDAMRAMHDWASVRAEEKAAQLERIPVDDDGTILVQRIVSCRVEDLRRALGLFWTSDIEQADIVASPWHVGGGPALMLSARVHHADVDWQTSCMARMDWYSGDCELEVRLKPDSPLSCVSAVQWLDDHGDHGSGLPVILPDLDWTT